jgi:hypothetical protein
MHEFVLHSTVNVALISIFVCFLFVAQHFLLLKTSEFLLKRNKRFVRVVAVTLLSFDLVDTIDVNGNDSKMVIQIRENMQEGNKSTFLLLLLLAAATIHVQLRLTTLF